MFFYLQVDSQGKLYCAACTYHCLERSADVDCVQMDSSLQGMLNENSFDLTSKFADLIAASAVSNDSLSTPVSSAMDLTAQSADTNVSIDVAYQ